MTGPRIGFQRAIALPFDQEGVEFDQAVEWMRNRLDRLVSALQPQAQRMLRESD